ncbi:Glyoxalase-like domain protein [compost metagenome]
MEHRAKSIRPFIGAKDFKMSRSFYRELGFKETEISQDMSVFETGNMAFYLQDYYNKDWVNNTMLFMEVDDVTRFWDELITLDLTSKYKNVRLKPIVNLDWGRECFIHDPSGILWHIGEFKQ